MNAVYSEKPYKLTFELRQRYLYVRVEANHDSYEISSRYWADVAKQCRASHARRLLVDEDIPEHFSLTEAFQLASELPKMGFYGVRIAFVDRHSDQDEINKFSELVAVNRGLDTKTFSRFADAEQWLLRD